MNAFLRWFRRLGIPVMGLLFFGSLVILYPESSPGNPPWGGVNRETVAALALGVLLSYLVFETGIALSHYLDRHLTWERHPLRRVGLQTGLQTVLAGSITLATGWFFAHLGGYDTPAQPLLLTDLLPLLLVGLFTAFLLSGVYIGASFFNYWQAEIEAREAAERTALQAQVQVLQQQLDPHFLFNTLSTLTAVIEADPARAVTFVQRLPRCTATCCNTATRPGCRCVSSWVWCGRTCICCKRAFPKGWKWSWRWGKNTAAGWCCRWWCSCWSKTR